MQALADLHHDHAVLDATINHLDALLRRPRQAHASDVRAVLKVLVRQLAAHLRFEEVTFYLPLHASGHARPDLVKRLLAEHEDLRETLRQLARFRSNPRLLGSDVFLLYSAHLVDLYREHSDREQQCLFPALEQLPPARLSRGRDLERSCPSRESGCSTIEPCLEIDSSRITG